jgi:hypothetical protein
MFYRRDIGDKALREKPAAAETAVAAPETKA